MRDWLILDIATAALPDAERYLEGTVRAPGNYKDPAKIAEAIAEKTAERVRMAATDVDLARVTGIGTRSVIFPLSVAIFSTQEDEYQSLRDLAAEIRRQHPVIVTFGGFSFDLPLLMRRARYLGVDFPKLDLDRYRSVHVDLCEILSDRNNDRKRSLQFYARRLGWDDLKKPLSGAEEAQVPNSGKWTELAESIQHDVTATYRLAQWLGIIHTTDEDVTL